MNRRSMKSAARNSFQFAVAALAVIMIGAACGRQSQAPSDARPPNGHISFTDDLGRTVSLEAGARRIVSLAPNLTEIAYAAGAGAQLVGVTGACDYPAAVDTLPEVSALPFNAEAVAALRPDLVLGTTQINNPRLTEMMEAIGAPAAFFSFGSASDIFDAIRAVGRLAGTSSRADAAADSLQDAFSALRHRTGAISNRPSVLLLVGDRMLYSFGAKSYVQDVILAAGGRSVTATIESVAPVLTDEFVLQQRPEVIIGAWGAEYDIRRLIEYHPSWSALPAVRNRRVYTVPPSLILRPGPRVVEGARMIAGILFPESALGSPRLVGSSTHRF